MTTFAAHLGLTLTWCFVTGGFAPINVLIGALLGLVVLWLPHRVLGGQSDYFRRLGHIVWLIWLFFLELTLANVRVARAVLGPTSRLRPGIVKVPLQARSDLAITLYGNLITLTPGTLTLDVAEDRSCLWVHAMDAEDPEALRAELRDGFETTIIAALEPPAGEAPPVGKPGLATEGGS